MPKRDNPGAARAGTKVPEAIDALLRANPDVPAALVELARRTGQLQVVRPGAQVFAAGDSVAGLHLLLEGRVRVTRQSGGRAVGVHTESAGGVLGEIALFSEGTYPATAIALEPAVLCLIPAHAVKEAVAGDGTFADLLLSRMARRARGVIARLDEIAHLTVLQRLALYLAERHTRLRAETISLGMTQTLLAEELGTVKELVVRELRALCRLGALSPAGAGKYRVVDATRLRLLAAESPQRMRTRRQRSVGNAKPTTAPKAAPHLAPSSAARQSRR